MPDKALGVKRLAPARLPSLTVLTGRPSARKRSAIVVSRPIARILIRDRVELYRTSPFALPGPVEPAPVKVIPGLGLA